MGKSWLLEELKYRLEYLAGEARCYGYADDPDYLEIKTYLENKLQELEGAI